MSGDEAATFWGVRYAEPLPPEPRLRHGALVVAGTTALAAVLGAGTIVHAALSGGGPQPESRVPGDALVYAEVDLDPSAEEKVDLLRLARRFPDVDTTGDDLRRALLRQPLGAAGADYDRDLAPWLGDRAAVALLPPQDAAQPEALLVLQSTDDAAAEAGLRRLREATGAELGWVVRDGWALLAPTQAAAEAAGARADTAPLGEDAVYAGDVGRLDDDRVVTVWADLAEVARLAPGTLTVPPVEGDASTGAPPGPAPGGLVPGGLGLTRPEDAGRVVLGVGAGPDRVEVEVRSVGGRHPVPTASGELTTLAGRVPDDSSAVLALSGGGEHVVPEWQRLRQGGEAPLLDAARDGAAALGLVLPEDLATGLGREAVVAVGPVREDVPAVGLRTAGDAPRVQDLFARVATALAGEAGTTDLARRDTADGAVLATTPELADRLAAADGGLGRTDRFREAVPELDDPWAVAYVDLAGVLDGLAVESPEPVPAGLRPLQSFGFAAHTDDGDQVMRLRVVVR